MNTILTRIIDAAHQNGLTQKVLAQRANIAEETLSRAKKRGAIQSDTLERLAAVAGISIDIATRPRPQPVSLPPASFRERYRDLVWSNTNAPDETYIRQALLKPRFMTLLDAAIEFGVERIEREWQLLKEVPEPQVSRVAPITEHIIDNIHNGYRQATA